MSAILADFTPLFLLPREKAVANVPEIEPEVDGRLGEVGEGGTEAADVLCEGR